jgi:hypothetical protein
VASAVVISASVATLQVAGAVSSKSKSVIIQNSVSQASSILANQEALRVNVSTPDVDGIVTLPANSVVHL